MRVRTHAGRDQTRVRWEAISFPNAWVDAEGPLALKRAVRLMFAGSFSGTKIAYVDRASSTGNLN